MYIIHLDIEIDFGYQNTMETKSGLTFQIRHNWYQVLLIKIKSCGIDTPIYKKKLLVIQYMYLKSKTLQISEVADVLVPIFFLNLHYCNISFLSLCVVLVAKGEGHTQCLAAQCNIKYSEGLCTDLCAHLRHSG